MSLSDLASLGSFVSGLAVLVSLVFLYFQLKQVNAQVKQAEKNQQATIRQGRAAILADINLRLAEGLHEVYFPMLRGEATNVDQVRRGIAIAQAIFQVQEEQFDQYRQGFLSDDAFASFQEQISSNMHWPGLRAAWAHLRPRYGKHFAAFVDRVVAETKPSALGLTTEGWNASVEAELAKNPA